MRYVKKIARRRYPKGIFSSRGHNITDSIPKGILTEMSKNIKSTAELSLPEAYEIEYSESLPDVDSLGIVLRHK